MNNVVEPEEKVLTSLHLIDKILTSLQNNHIFVCSSSWKILYANNNFIGYVKSELVSLNIYNDLLDHNMISAAHEILTLDKLPFLHKSKHIISYNFKLLSLHDMHVMIIDTREIDVTYKTMFVTNISNQLKIPLTGILNTIKQLEYTTLTNEQAELTKVIKENSSELLITINDVLDITKLESDNIDLNLSPFSVVKFIEDNIGLLITEKLSEYITINYNVSSTTPKYIVSDYHRLSQILINILKNAIRYTHTNHKNNITITVDAEYVCPYDPNKLPISKNSSLLNLLKSSDSVSNEYGINLPVSRNSSMELTNSDEYVEHIFEIDSDSRLGDIYLLKWTIRDHGIGIPKSKIHKLFNNNFNSEDFKKNGNYGLGLTICKQLCDLFKGKIWVAESGSSRGTTMCFNIYAQIFNYIGKTEYNDKLIKKKVLFVDEDQNSRMTMCKSLLNLEMEPTACASFIEALMFINKTHFDLVIINIPNPDVAGVQLAQKIKKMYPSLPIIAIYDVENIIDKVHDIYFRYVMKPIKMENLISVLVAAIENRTTVENEYDSASTSSTNNADNSDEQIRKLSLITYRNPNSQSHHSANTTNHRNNSMIEPHEMYKHNNLMKDVNLMPTLKSNIQNINNNLNSSIPIEFYDNNVKHISMDERKHIDDTQPLRKISENFSARKPPTNKHSELGGPIVKSPPSNRKL